MKALLAAVLAALALSACTPAHQPMDDGDDRCAYGMTDCPLGFVK